jgi:signal transduction histidine kinase/ActR/RegA family two-component response regulator
LKRAISIILTLVTLALCAWLFVDGIPEAQSLLRDRELQYVKRFLADVVDASRSRTLDNDWYESQQGRFDHLAFEGGAFFSLDKAALLVHGTGGFSSGNVQDKLKMRDGSNLLKGLVSGTGIRNLEVQRGAEAQRLFVSATDGSGAAMLCVLIPESQLFAVADIATRNITIMVGLGLLLFLLLAYEYKQRLRHRYNKIQHAVKAIADGNYDVEVKVPRGSLRRLMGTINQLAEKMREKEALEEQLVRSQKMEVVGTLASGIAHDFNNVLGGINGALDLIKGECKEGASAVDLDMIEQMSDVAVDCVKRGRDTVDRLLSFSRKSEKQREVVDLNAVIASIKKICTHSFDKRIEVRLEPWGGLATVSGNRSDLEQAVLNLCINARDAMDGTGQLTIKVGRVPESDLPLKRAKAAGPHFCLLLKDTGCGMDAATIDQVFEPFFTTKEKGKGTGLGLAMVYRIVDDVSGWIDVDSAKGKGTTFSLYFPCEVADDSMVMSVEVAAELEAEHRESAAADAAGTETILVIEDDAILRELTVEYLQRSGYRALTAKDGGVGIEIFNEQLESIDGVILDLILPTLSGEIVFERMKQLDPDVRVLLTSGSSNDKLITHMLMTGCRGFLPKPYSLEELTAAVTNHLLPAGRRR